MQRRNLFRGLGKDILGSKKLEINCAPQILRSWLVYQTPKIAIINNVGIGIVHKLCQLGVVLYVVVSILVWQTYMHKETPATITTAKAVRGESSAPASRSAWYCNNATTDYRLGEGALYVRNQCIDYLSDAEASSAEGSNKLFVTTFLTQRYVNDNCTLGTSSPSEFDECRQLVLSNASAFVLDAEKVHVEWFSYYATSWGQYNRADKLVVSGPGSSARREFARDEAPLMLLGELLSMAGVSLDDRHTNSGGACQSRADTSSTVCSLDSQFQWPLYRMTGLAITMSMRWEQHFISGKVTCHLEVRQGHQGLWVQRMASTWYTGINKEGLNDVIRSHLDRTYHGVEFHFIPSGYVARFVWGRLWSSIADGVILVILASLVFDCILMMISPTVRQKKVEVMLDQKMFAVFKNNFEQYKMVINPDDLKVTMPDGHRSYLEVLQHHERALTTIAHFAKKRMDFMQVALLDLRKVLDTSTRSERTHMLSHSNMDGSLSGTPVKPPNMGVRRMSAIIAGEGSLSNDANPVLQQHIVKKDALMDSPPSPDTGSSCSSDICSNQDDPHDVLVDMDPARPTLHTQAVTAEAQSGFRFKEFKSDDVFNGANRIRAMEIGDAKISQPSSADRNLFEALEQYKRDNLEDTEVRECTVMDFMSYFSRS